MSRHHSFLERTSCALVLVCVTLVGARFVGAQTVTSAPGYIYSLLELSDLTQSCVATGAAGTFVGRGPGFTGNGQSIVFVTESGAERVVASGFNAISDCVYDRASDVLYVGDNGLEASGSVTGDTVFAIPSASTSSALTALGLELVPAGSVPEAFSLALDADGIVHVSNAAGSGAGSVQKIVNGTLVPFIASGLDFAGGLAFEPGGSLLVAESLSSFESQVSRYDAAGSFVEVLSGPGFAHGSFDLAITLEGDAVVTGQFGGDVVALDRTTGSASAFASGFSFATAIDVDAFTGRVTLTSSTFIPEDEDFRLHRLTPVEGLLADSGEIDGKRASRECVAELYGAQLVAKKPGKKAKQAICVDGAACDADGIVNDSCTFPIGFCVNVADPRLPNCVSPGIDAFQLKKVKPASASLSGVATALQAAAPIADPTCVFSDGVVVPVRVKPNGKKKAFKGLIKTKVTSSGAKPFKDTDKLKLVCMPG